MAGTTALSPVYVDDPASGTSTKPKPVGGWDIIKTETPTPSAPEPKQPVPGGGWSPVPSQTSGWVAKAMEPITSYLPTQQKMAREGMQGMSEGVSDIGAGNKASGGWKVVTGALKYVTSPIEAGLHTVVGKPLEENLGIPHEYSELAASLALPGYGFTKTKSGQEAIEAARNAGKVIEKIASPETVDAEAKMAVASIREMGGQAARDTAQTAQALEPAWKKVNALPDVDRLNFIDYVEGRSKDIFYHGTNRAFDNFEISKLQSSSGSKDAAQGFYFTPDKEIASFFADSPQKGRIIAAELDLKNPLTIDLTTVGPGQKAAIIERAFSAGHDAVVFKNASEGKGPISTTIVVKATEQIKQLKQDRAVADPMLQDLADTMKAAFDKRMAKIQALPSHQQMSFVQDYFPHFWKDPAKAQQALQGSGGAARQGSGASLKARSVPTIADGLAMGLEPVTTNPLEATMRYVTSMDKFIAATEVLDTAKNAGQVKYIQPKVMGASGHPNSFQGVPDGWKALEGRGSTNANGAQAYAPEGFARVYNNWISRGIAEHGEEFGTAYEAARRGSNAITALELGLSGYHVLTMMQESMVNSIANAVGYARKGMPVEAVKSVGKATVAPVSYALKGKKIQDIYLGLSPGTAEMQKITDLLTAAGGRAKGAEHAPDYNFSKTGSYWTAYRRGALKLQRAANRAAIQNSPVFGRIGVYAKNIGRIMDTVAQPIFEVYIPKIKNAAFYENMSAWLKQNPNASREEQVKAARQVWDSVDNRFGELVQDNIFVDKLIKQMGMLSLRSWSWAVGGDVRELGGAARDIARAPFKKPTGTGPNEGKWTQKMDYAIALPVVYGTLSALYQGLKTGKPPGSIQDVLAPQTGGVDAATGQPERLMIPGYMKDVFGFIEHPVDEITNKTATAPKVLGQLATNEDWKRDPIFSPASDSELNAPIWLKQFWNYATETLGPISARNLAKGQKAGSNLSGIETMLGVRTAPRYLTDPEGYEQMMKGVHGRKWKQKEKRDKKQQGLYE